MNVIIVGTGGMAKEVWGLLREINRHSYGLNVVGFVAQTYQPNRQFMGLPVLGDDAWLLDQKESQIVLANADPVIRQQMYERFAGRHRFPSFVSPCANLMGSVGIGDGVTIMPGCIIQPDVLVGDFCHINMGTTIGHDCKIGNFVTINPNAALSGNLTVADGVLIGAGATILETNQVGYRAVIGAGATLTKSVPPGETWIGTAAGPIRRTTVASETKT